MRVAIKDKHTGLYLRGLGNKQPFAPFGLLYTNMQTAKAAIKNAEAKYDCDLIIVPEDQYDGCAGSVNQQPAEQLQLI